MNSEISIHSILCLAIGCVLIIQFLSSVKCTFSLDTNNEILIYFNWRFWWFFKIFFSLLVLWGFMNLFIQKFPYPLKSQWDFAYVSSSTNIIKITHHLRSYMRTLLKESSRLWPVAIKNSLGYWLNITWKDLVLFRVMTQEDQQIFISSQCGREKAHGWRLSLPTAT